MVFEDSGKIVLRKTTSLHQRYSALIGDYVVYNDLKTSEGRGAIHTDIHMDRTITFTRGEGVYMWGMWPYLLINLCIALELRSMIQRQIFSNRGRYLVVFRRTSVTIIRLILCFIVA